MTAAILRNSALVLATLPVLGRVAVGQCENAWTAFAEARTTSGQILDMKLWDPDGAGPLPEEVVIGGAFGAAGGEVIPYLAAYDPVQNTWRSLGGGTNGTVRSIDVLPNGDLVIGGDFTEAGGVPAVGVAVWDGSSWAGLGNAPGVLSVLATSTGEIVVGGRFTAIDGVAALNVARWDGAAWHPMATGLVDVSWLGFAPGVVDLAELDTGEIVAVGGLIDRVSVWDGNAWTANAPTVSAVVCVLAEPGGSFIVSGLGQSNQQVATWNGSSWSAMGAAGGVVRDLARLPNGDLIAAYDGAGGAGSFASGVMRYRNGIRTMLGGAGSSSISAVEALPGSGGALLVGGRASAIGPVQGQNLFHYDGSQFLGAAPWIDGDYAVKTLSNGEVYAFGSFSSIGGVPFQRIARWDNGWHAVGAGLPANVNDLDGFPDGRLVAACTNLVYQFDGSAWSFMSQSPIGGKLILARPTGEIAVTAGSSDTLNWFDGSTWSVVGSSSPARFITGMALLPDGDIVLSSSTLSGLPISYGRIGRWDGASTWTALDPSWTVTNPSGITATPAGDIWVIDIANPFFGTSQVVRLVGSTWTQAGVLDGFPAQLSTNSANDVFVAGLFTQSSGQPCRHLGRWDGSNWQPVAGGAPEGSARVALAENGDTLTVGGGLFLHRTACPASAQPVAAGCAGSHGPNDLEAEILPLAGGVYEARATGLPASALVVDGYGFTLASTPLINLTPFAAPGCTLALVPDVIVSRLASGSATSRLTIPSDPTWIGSTFHHQMLVVELGGASIVEVTVTDTIAATIGRGY